MIVKQKQRETKIKALKAVYKAKSEPERNRFGGVRQGHNHKQEMFKLAKEINKTNQDVIGEQSIRNDVGVLE